MKKSKQKLFIVEASEVVIYSVEIRAKDEEEARELIMSGDIEIGEAEDSNGFQIDNVFEANSFACSKCGEIYSEESGATKGFVCDKCEEKKPLKCTHKGCKKLQDGEGEFCPKHYPKNKLACGHKKGIDIEGQCIVCGETRKKDE